MTPAQALALQTPGAAAFDVRVVGEIAPQARLFAKLESVNPGGSIKDRPVARMLTEAIAGGCLANGRRFLDSSSGNAGISYAMLGATLGVPVSIVIPGNATLQTQVAIKRRWQVRGSGAQGIRSVINNRSS